MSSDNTEPPSPNSRPAGAPVGRRAVLGAAGATAGSLALAMSARRTSAAPIQTAQADAGPPVRIARARLDALVAKFYPVFNERDALGAFAAERHGARYDVELRSFTTLSRVPRTGEPVEVSGLLAVPAGREGPVPVVSWQHGTILSFDQVPSNLTKLAAASYELRDSADSLETLFNVQRFAGNGYAVIAADYLGKGPHRNGRDEAYAVKDITVQVCLDVLQAGVRELEKTGRRPSALFLNGWSQGALNTQWLKQDLQRRGIAVAATAAQSPFNDLPDTFHYWSSPQSVVPSTQSYPAPPAWIVPCLIVLLGSYRRYYGMADLFETAIKPKYRAFAEKYWSDYTLDAETARTIPPASDFLADGLFQRFTHETNGKLLRLLAANSTTFWDYDSPIRLYYGLADEALPPSLVSMALAAGGRHMAGVPVKGASHRATFLGSLYGDAGALGGQSTVFDWFNSHL